nr:Uncharacterised protein [Salmonella sp. NCTC 7297]
MIRFTVGIDNVQRFQIVQYPVDTAGRRRKFLTKILAYQAK